jgi:hypothetical protein
MKRAIVLLLALLLVPAARADAKFSSARVCGASDCREVAVTAGHTVVTMMEAAVSTPLRLNSKPPEASPWYRVTLCPGQCDSPHALTLKILPAGGYEYLAPNEQLTRKGWAELDEPAAEVYRRVTKGLEPFPASRLLALGAKEPNSVPSEDPVSQGPSDQGGIPAGAWTAIAMAAAALALISLRWLQRLRRSASLR